MSKQSIDASAEMEGTRQSEQVFPVEREYARCVTALNRAGILTLLPKSESIGVIGIDGKEYPIPTLSLAPPDHLCIDSGKRWQTSPYHPHRHRRRGGLG